MRATLFLISICVAIGFVSGYGEPTSPSGGPVWQERANHYFTNAVRIAPTKYKSIYMTSYSSSVIANILLPATYPAVAPLYMVPQLVASSEAHSKDMATTNTFSHSSSDGTPVFTRIASYYNCSGTMGENIAAGYSSPLDTNNQWLCDGNSSLCAVDGSGNDGHRSNIMDEDYIGIGVGYAYNTTDTYRYLWTQDFGGNTCPPRPTTPIYSGSHYTPTTGNTKFVSIFSSSASPTSSNVVVAGSSFSLSLELGAAAEGSYVYTQTAGTACRSYYFTFVEGSTTYRYPDTGCLVTYGEGSCTTTFDASCTGNSATAATTAATTASTSTSTSTSTTTTTAATTSTSAKAATTSTTSAAATTSTSAKAATTSTTAAATSTSAKVATTSTTTTAKATTGSTTGSSGVYYIYSTSVQNSWTTIPQNSGMKITSVTYEGETALSTSLTAASGSGYFIEFYHNPAVSTSSFTSVKFNIAASASGTINVFLNGGYTVQESVSTSWKAVTIPITSLGSTTFIATIGYPNELVFANGGTSTITIYLYNIELV